MSYAVRRDLRAAVIALALALFIGAAFFAGAYALDQWVWQYLLPFPGASVVWAGAIATFAFLYTLVAEFREHR